MASHYNGTITFEDLQKKRSTMTFAGISDMNTLITLANAMSGRSCGIAVGVTVSEQQDSVAGVGSAVEGKWDSCEDKAEVVLEDVETGRVSRFQLPAPLDTLMQHNEGVGYVMKKAQGDAFASDVNTATGRTFRFVKGRHVARSTKAQV